MKRSILAVLMLACLIAPAAICSGQLGKAKAAWTARLEPTDARAGEGAQVVLTATITPEWHIYAPTTAPGGPVATTIVVAKGGPLTAAGAIAQPPPKRVKDPGFGIMVDEYEGTVALGLPVKLAAGLHGTQKALVEVRYQACNGNLCDPPDTVKLPVTFNVAAGPVRANRTRPVTAVPAQPGKKADAGAAPPVAGTTAPPSGGPGSGGGLLAFVWLAIGAGFAALLTPCVFPMIPITVSFFIKRRDAEGTARIAGPLAYCLGIMSTFTLVGVLAAVLFGATAIQRFANHPITNIALAVLFVVLAANLFGVYEIVLPSGLINKVAGGQRRGGLLGPYFMGLAFALTSFTCTVAFVGTLLVTASTGSVVRPIIGMLAFSAAFALPFFLLALFPSWLERLPESGGWMVSVKAFLGFLELAAALKFLSNADLVLSKGWLTRPVFLAVWTGLFVVAGLYLLGWLRMPHDVEGLKIGWLRRVLGVATVAAGLFWLAGVGGASLGEWLDPFVPPDPYPGHESASSTGIAFLPKYSWAEAIAAKEDRPIFINFTGVTCTNCRKMEHSVLNRPDVVDLLRNFVPAELYTDRGTPEDDDNKAREQRLRNVVTLPLYVVVTPDGRVVRSFDKGYTPDPQEFVAFLKDAVAAAPRPASAQITAR